MKLNNILTVFLMIFITNLILAQEKSPLDQNREQPKPVQQIFRLNALKELELTTEQIEKIRNINRVNRPLIRAAQQRLQRANRTLDEAIYSDSLDEKLIEQRVKEVQTAQAELLRLRIKTEVELRKILTPEQLQKFRQLRQDKLRNRVLLTPVRPSVNP
ncbi:MAG: periplasmic heavy metal sensor [Acidobacteria bacterium]|nr:MAG: periplasmic heavy metal sensor [Acidobacteriota bacterium]